MEEYKVDVEELLQEIKAEISDLWSAETIIENGKLITRFSNGEWFKVIIEKILNKAVN